MLGTQVAVDGAGRGPPPRRAPAGLHRRRPARLHRTDGDRRVGAPAALRRTAHRQCRAGDGAFEVVPLARRRARSLWSERLDLPLGAGGALGWRLARPRVPARDRAFARKMARRCEAAHSAGELSRCGLFQLIRRPNTSWITDERVGPPAALGSPRCLSELFWRASSRACRGWSSCAKGRVLAPRSPGSIWPPSPDSTRPTPFLLADAGIVCNRLKIQATVANARAPPPPPRRLLWSFAPATHPRPATLAHVPRHHPESAAMAKELKRRGLRFVGPTTCYALMQAAGLFDDHVRAAGAPRPPPSRA